MQNCISTFSLSKLFQFVNDQLCWQRRNIHFHDCHSPPHALRIGLYDDTSPPQRSAALARLDPWATPPTHVGFSGDVIRRRRFPWVEGYSFGTTTVSGLPAERIDGRDPTVHTNPVCVDMMHGIGIPALR